MRFWQSILLIIIISLIVSVSCTYVSLKLFKEQLSEKLVTRELIIEGEDGYAKMSQLKDENGKAISNAPVLRFVQDSDVGLSIGVISEGPRLSLYDNRTGISNTLSEGGYEIVVNDIKRAALFTNTNGVYFTMAKNESINQVVLGVSDRNNLSMLNLNDSNGKFSFTASVTDNGPVDVNLADMIMKNRLALGFYNGEGGIMIIDENKLVRMALSKFGMVVNDGEQKKSAVLEEQKK